MKLIAVDFETHRFAPGILAPPPVCMSVADASGGRLYSVKEARTVFEQILRSDQVIAGTNFCFDAVVAAAEWPELLPLIFDKYERGQIFDVAIAQALDAIAKGIFCLDPQTRKAMRKPPGPDGKLGKNTDRYSLELCVWQVLGRANAKENDEYRLRYHELEHVPLERWPDSARKYPVDDAVNTLEVALTQLEGHENLHRMALETRAAFVLQLSSVHGLRTDPVAVQKLEDSLNARLAKAVEDFQEIGLLLVDEDGKVKENGILKKTMVARAYGAKDPCKACAGSGKVASAKTKNQVQCKACSATGLEFAPGTPRTPPSASNPEGGLCADRDVLSESGDDVLEAFAEVSEIEKGLNTYLPWLKEGIDRPINVEPKVLGAETLRTSYSGLVQLIPRKGGFRECFVPRPGRKFCSVDYAAVELSTFAEVLLEIVGWSRMADAINADRELHSLFASGMMLVPYEEMRRLVKAEDAVAKNQRQMSKEANFGFGGLMGGARFAGSVRKKGLRLCIAAGKAPQCPDCQGVKGRKCRKCYKRGFICGVKKVTQWGRNPRPITPTCETCILVAEDLRTKWMDQWPEVKEYFAWVKSLASPGTGTIRMRSPITNVIRGEIAASQASNHPFQHLAGTGAKEALWLIGKESYLDTKSPIYGSRVAVFAHDETLMEHDEERAHEASMRQVELMLAGMRMVVKRVKVTAEPALMNRWLKDAAPRFNAQGRLIPWEPEEKKPA